MILNQIWLHLEKPPINNLLLDSTSYVLELSYRAADPTKFHEKTFREEETEGNSFKLEGRVAGSQPISVAWYKNNIEIHPTPNCEITFKSNTLLLQIKRAGMDDAGLYTCSKRMMQALLCVHLRSSSKVSLPPVPSITVSLLPIRQAMYASLDDSTYFWIPDMYYLIVYTIALMLTKIYIYMYYL